MLAQVTCKYFGECGGCNLYDLSEDQYNVYKVNILSSALSKHKIDFRSNDLVFEKVANHDRQRIALHFDKKNCGFYKVNSHDIVNIEQCLVATENINDFIRIIPKLLSIIEVGSGKIEVLDCANGLDLSIISDKKIDILQLPLLRKFMLANKICRVAFNREVLIELSKPNINLCNIDFKLPLQPFLQASIKTIIKFNKEISALVKPKERILDLFCGIGTYSLPLLQTNQVFSYDFSDNMIKNLVENSNFNNTRFKASAFCQNLDEKPILTSQLKNFDMAIVNPPSAGAFKQFQQLAKSDIKKIIVISCNPLTFARDIKLLINNDYKIKKMLAFDQFLYTKHLEVFCYLEKK